MVIFLQVYDNNNQIVRENSITSHYHHVVLFVNAFNFIITQEVVQFYFYSCRNLRTNVPTCFRVGTYAYYSIAYLLCFVWELITTHPHIVVCV